MLKGYKTYIGATIIAASAALSYLGYGDISEMVLTVGGALGLAGLRGAIK